MTALLWAAESGQAAVVAQLVEAGADATLRATGGPREGKTALEIAEDPSPAPVKQGHAEVTALLRQPRQATAEEPPGSAQAESEAARAARAASMAPGSFDLAPS